MHNINPSTFYVDPRSDYKRLGIKLRKAFRLESLLIGDPPGARTQDPILKRDVLYLLS